MLNSLRNKAKSLGTCYVEGEVVDFGFKIDESIIVEEDSAKEYEGINSVKVGISVKYFVHCQESNQGSMGFEPL